MANDRSFESVCWQCSTRITTRDGGMTWKHDTKPAGERHQAHAVGTMRQI